ncbi:MAG: ATP-binding protein [Methanomassiliicoccaceae archaeon]|nr:ATP-binding protein [Methanomassiliicoccaceae archaeon]
MLKRKILDHLNQWKKEKEKECLLLTGARQVGKTFIIREFAKQNYKNVIELNFATKSSLKEIFKKDLDMDTLIKGITDRIPAAKFEEGKTLLFLDEIQECGDARTALKPIAEDNRFDCIASGSMLGIAYKTTKLIPIGYERRVEMFSLDFEEYLWSAGYGDFQIGNLREYFEKKKQIPSSGNDVYTKLFREYAIVGGMPSVVNTFLRTKNFGMVHKEQKRIIASYMDDIARYLPENEKVKATNCYLSIPAQLAKENKKFQYSVLEQGGDAEKYGNSLEWLRDAGLIKFCNNVTSPFFPLEAYKDEGFFKIYVTDIGLLNAMYGLKMKSEFYNNTLKGPAKGGIYENLIADILIKKEIPLNYYKPKEGKQEIEFLLANEDGIIPIEVKARNGKTLSLTKFIEKFKPPYALKFIDGNVGTDGKRITMPHYMSMFL